MKNKKYCHFCAHPLIEKHFEGRLRLFCNQCHSAIYENPIPATAAVVFNNKNELLLIKRAVEPAKGQWCLPGGFIEIDETAEQCCIREMKEETGLIVKINCLLGAHISKSVLYKSVLINGFLIKEWEGELLAGDDAMDVQFFPIAKMPLLAFASHQALIKNAFSYLHDQNQSGRELKQSAFPEKFGCYVITSQDHLQIAKDACSAGAKVIQYRVKDASRSDIIFTAREIRKITRAYNSLFIINDYFDIALFTGADGIHLGQDDFSLTEARKWAPQGFYIGISTHSLEQAMAAQAGGADYIGIGPVFKTPTKQDYTPIGLDVVKSVTENISIPIVAIGGLNTDNIMLLQQLGICNFAMVREFQTNTADVVSTINQKA